MRCHSISKIAELDGKLVIGLATARLRSSPMGNVGIELCCKKHFRSVGQNFDKSSPDLLSKQNYRKVTSMMSYLLVGMQALNGKRRIPVPDAHHASKLNSLPTEGLTKLFGPI